MYQYQTRYPTQKANTYNGDNYRRMNNMNGLTYTSAGASYDPRHFFEFNRYFTAITI